MATQERTRGDRKTSPPPAVRGRILHTSGDACVLDLGEYGKGRLKQEDSLARDGSEPLEELPAYKLGRESMFAPRRCAYGFAPMTRSKDFVFLPR
ncbi:MAG: hypothetical protein H0T87_10300 [Gammaproteobacteria bacterium]|nr:hypothetical protein [Gammaproteobacteria bacterium]